MKSKKVIIILSLIIVCLLGVFIYFYMVSNTPKEKTFPKTKKNPIKEEEIVNITISAVGDCTFTNDEKVANDWNNFNSYLKNDDYSYYFAKVYDVLSKDDLTIANLEGTFTEETEKAIKTFNFKNTKDFVNILTEGSVEIVNLANNHTYDYKVKGYEDTKLVLEEANIPYFGYENYKIEEIKGIKLGFIGLNYYDEKNYNNYKKEIGEGIAYLKEQNVNLIIINFHWGIEATYEQTKMQEEVGRFAIDSGADLVLGHHPHRIQGIENYNGKYIVYSLSNFVFGGHRNPSDKDSFIYQQTFTFKNKELTNNNVNIVPVRISGEDNLNNYQPVIATGEEKNKIIDKINQYSINFRWQDEGNNN